MWLIWIYDEIGWYGSQRKHGERQSIYISEGTKKTRKEKSSSSSLQVPRRTLGIKWVEQEGQEWYKENKAPNYLPIDLIHIESLARHYPRIMAKITQLTRVNLI